MNELIPLYSCAELRTSFDSLQKLNSDLDAALVSAMDTGVFIELAIIADQLELELSQLEREVHAVMIGAEMEQERLDKVLARLRHIEKAFGMPNESLSPIILETGGRTGAELGQIFKASHSPDDNLIHHLNKGHFVIDPSKKTTAFVRVPAQYISGLGCRELVLARVLEAIKNKPELGLLPCPQDTGVVFRLQKDYKDGDVVYVISEPIKLLPGGLSTGSDVIVSVSDKMSSYSNPIHNIDFRHAAWSMTNGDVDFLFAINE